MIDSIFIGCLLRIERSGNLRWLSGDAKHRKTGVVSFTASKKVFITTITSVLNSIFIAFLFWIEGSGNLCCSSEDEKIKNCIRTTPTLRSKRGILRVTVMEKILIKIKMIMPNSSLIMWWFQMEGSGNVPCRSEKILCPTNNGEQERYCRSYEDGNVLRNDSNECAK